MTGKNNFLSRRGMMAASGATLLAGATGIDSAKAASDTGGMPQEGPDTPKLTMYISADPTESEMKKIKQIGINWVDMPDMPPPPWTEDWFRKRMDLLATQGLKLGIVMVPWFKNGAMEPEFLKVVHGLPGRDEMIEKLKASIVAAGKADMTFTLVPKNEWDVAAGAALVESAGGWTLKLDHSPLRCNQKDPLISGLLAGGPFLRDPLLALLERHSQTVDSHRS